MMLIISVEVHRLQNKFHYIRILLYVRKFDHFIQGGSWTWFLIEKLKMFGMIHF